MTSLRFSDMTAAILALKAHVDITKFILEDVKPEAEPKKSGNNTFIWCPFHGENKKPSFSINDRLRSYRCFGCHESGDIVKWVTKFHGVSTIEAIEKIATRTGFNLGPFTRASTEDEKKLDQYQALYNAVSTYCHNLLIENKPQLAWYLADSGFTEDMIAPYKVGYCPSVEVITRFAYNFGSVQQVDLQKLELIRPDMWNHAMVYPIHDMSGHVARFYCKPLSITSQSLGKYIGTSEKNPLFKSGLMFGLNLHRKDLRTKGFKLRLVEGFKGAIASDACALMGTKFTIEQVASLKKLDVKEAVVCFDGDEAGRTASLKILDSFNDYSGLSVKIARLPDGLQPDTLRRSLGKSAVDNVFDDALLPMQFYVSDRFGSGPLAPVDQQQLLTNIRPLLKNMSLMDAEIASKYIAEVLGIQSNVMSEWTREVRLEGSQLINMEAEKSVLQHVLLNPVNWAYLVRHNFTDAHFNITDHRRVYDGIKIAYGEYQNKITAQVVKDKLAIKYPGNAELVNTVNGFIEMPQKYEFIAAVGTVVDLWKRRSVAENSKALAGSVCDLSKPVDDTVLTSRRELVQIIDTVSGTVSTPKDVTELAMKTLHERIEIDGSIIGFDFSDVKDIDGKIVGGQPILCNAMSGLQRQHQVVVSAHSGVGKSLWAANVAISIGVNQKIPGLIIPLEMNTTEWMFRAASILSGVSNTKIQNGTVTDEEYKRVTEAMRQWRSSEVHMAKPKNRSPEGIIATVEDYKVRHGIQWFILDYIQLVAPDEGNYNMKDYQVYGKMSERSKTIAEELNIAAVNIAQLNQTSYVEGDVVKGENAIGGAYKIKQDADEFITITRCSDEQMSNPELKSLGNRLLYLDKRRGGASDIMINVELDDSMESNFTLRFREKTNPGALIQAIQGAQRI